MSVNSLPQLLVYGMASDEQEDACPGPECAAACPTLFGGYAALQEEGCFCSMERK